MLLKSVCGHGALAGLPAFWAVTQDSFHIKNVNQKKNVWARVWPCFQVRFANVPERLEFYFKFVPMEEGNEFRAVLYTFLEASLSEMFAGDQRNVDCLTHSFSSMESLRKQSVPAVLSLVGALKLPW